MSALDRAMRIGVLAAAVGLGGVSHAQTQATPATAKQAKNVGGVYGLEQFGAVDTKENAQKAFEKAARAISASGGGTIVVPRSAAADWKAETAPQPMLREPDPPAPAAKWGTHPGVSVWDLRKPDTFFTAQTSGVQISRRLNLPMGKTIPQEMDAPLGTINNLVTRGTASYAQRAMEDVAAGFGVKATLPTIQGLYPGLTLVFGPRGGEGRFLVKGLDFDKATQSWTATGDLSKDLKKGDLLECVTRTGTLNLSTLSFNENQTFDFMVWHHAVGISSRNLVKASLKYQGDNVPSTPGGGSVVFNAYTEQLIHPFAGEVESFDPASGVLVYKRDAKKTDTLGSGRPIINMNPAKQVRAKVNVYGDWGAMVVVDDATVTEDMHGWFVAVDEPAERTAGTSALRWWPISYVQKKEGKTQIGILRYWWGAHAGRGVGDFYTDIKSNKDVKKEVRVVIAPGAMVYDASEGVQRPEKDIVNPGRVLKVVPRPFAGTEEDFAAGDAIVQAIGPDPWHPAIFRSWLFESVPSVGSCPIFDVQNNGPVARGRVMHVHGGARYDMMMNLPGGGPLGIVFQKEIPEGALVMNAAPAGAKSPLANGIVFTYSDGEKKRMATGLAADQTGRIVLGGAEGKGTSAGNQAVSGVTGLNSESGNLRGLAVSVAEGKADCRISFVKAESDGEYAVILRPNWITNYAVQEKGPEGLTVIFDRPAPKDAAVDWFLVR